MGHFLIAERACTASVLTLVDKSVFTKMSNFKINLIPDRGSSYKRLFLLLFQLCHLRFDFFFFPIVCQKSYRAASSVTDRSSITITLLYSSIVYIGLVVEAFRLIELVATGCQTLAHFLFTRIYFYPPYFLRKVFLVILISIALQ